MENNEVTTNIIEQAISGLFNRPIDIPSRKFSIRTGVAGFDLFDAAMEDRLGYKRLYIGKKVPRILRKLNFKIKRSVFEKYYRLIKK